MKFKSGVLHGEEVTELLNYANKNKFALPAVNVIGTSTILFFGNFLKGLNNVLFKSKDE